MIIDAHAAVVDNDFISHITECQIDDSKLIEILNIVFKELNLIAVMHPLVYDKELPQNNKRSILLFQKSVIKKASFSEIFQNDENKKHYYIFLVKELYKSLTGKIIPVSNDDVLKYWVRRNSLGEVHSVSMCLTCGCGIFLSDDSDSKKLESYIKRMSIGKIEVYNRTEFIQKHMTEGETNLSRREKRALTHST